MDIQTDLIFWLSSAMGWIDRSLDSTAKERSVLNTHCWYFFCTISITLVIYVVFHENSNKIQVFVYSSFLFDENREYNSQSNK